MVYYGDAKVQNNSLLQFLESGNNIHIYLSLAKDRCYSASVCRSKPIPYPSLSTEMYISFDES